MSSSYGIIGFGGIGRRIAARLAESPPAPRLVAFLVRPSQAADATAMVGREAVVTSLVAFVARQPDVAVEAASAATLAAIGPHLLGAGVDLLPLSLSALADPAVERALLAAAEAGPGRLEIPAGAMASIGFLAVARENGLRAVHVESAYPVARLVGTKADKMADLTAIRSRQAIFSGSVRELVAGFPRRVNVTVAVALAGLGLDRTRVTVVADPDLLQASFAVEAVAASGIVRLTVGPSEAPVGADPVDHTAFSVVRLLRRRLGRVMI